MESLSTEDCWEAPGDAALIDSLVSLASSGTGLILHGESGAGQDDIARRVARRLASDADPVELRPAEAALWLRRAESATSARRVFLIDISSFTEQDLDAVVQLVRRHGATIIATGIDPIPASAVQLARLERIRMRELSEASAAGFLERGLGGPVSDRAVHAVWESGAGNRGRMKMIVEDWCESSHLVRLDGVWVIRTPSHPAGPRLVRAWRARLAAHEPAVRDVFHVLSLAGELPLPVLLEACGSDAVDAVHELGSLRLRNSPARDASLRGIVNIEAIASQVPPGHSRDLLARVRALIAASGLPRPPGLVPWQMRCGLEPDPADAIDSAEQMLVAGSPAAALDLLRRIPAGADPERVESVRIGALLAGGQFIDALTVPDIPNESGDRASAAALIRASWSGDFRPILAAEGVEAQMPRGCEWLWHQVSHEALVMSGRVDEGVEADWELVRMLEQSDTAPYLLQRARLGLFDSETLAGEWTRAAATLAGGWNAEIGSPGEGRTGRLYNALAHVMTERFEDSTTILQRELPQLLALERYDLLPLAHALAALSFASIGEEERALASLGAVDPGGMWRLTWAARFFSAQAYGQLGRRGEAIELLMDCADRDRSLGNRAQELLAVSAALQWGHEPALERLDEVAGQTESRFARACRRVVHGLRAGDAESLAYGGAMARAIGQHRFADFAERSLKTLGRPEAAPRRMPSLRAQSLTPRQREVVGYVLSGDSSSDIARSIGVSVRTVESHLYQVYAKLGVGSRAELRSVLEDVDIARLT